MGRVYHEKCPHCSEECEIIAPKQGKRQFEYTCRYCTHTFMVDRDEEDVIMEATKAEKAMRAALWAFVGVFVIWALYIAFFTPQTTGSGYDGYLMFDINVPAEVYVDGGFVGTIENMRVPFTGLECQPVKVRLVYASFTWEKYVDPCDRVMVNDDFASWVVNGNK